MLELLARRLPTKTTTVADDAKVTEQIDRRDVGQGERDQWIQRRHRAAR